MSFPYPELRSAIRELHRRQANCEKAEHNYRVDRGWTDDYFRNSRLFDWQTEIRTYANTLREQGCLVIHLDVCGNTVATNMGFDHSYQMSMSRYGSLIKKGVTVYRGDIFARLSLQPFLNQILAERGQLALTTFRPLAGLQRFTPIYERERGAYQTLIYYRLYQQLAAVVAATRVGGYIHLERPFQFDDSIGDFLRKVKPHEMTGHVMLKTWARQLKCSIRLHRDSFGCKWLLRKDYKELGPIP
jgi:hypothetical protein